MQTFKTFLEEVTVDVSPYKNNTGKNPSGQGTWVFQSDTSMKSDSFEGQGTFAKVRTSAIKWAKKNGYSNLYVVE